MPPPDLLAAVEGLDPAPYSDEAFRHLAEQYSPLSGAGARSQGGRWNPPESFSTLYMALERETAVAEFMRMVERVGREPSDFLPRRLYRYRVELNELLDLRSDEARAMLGLGDEILRGADPTRCQEIGEAAHLLGFEGVLAPSATGSGSVLAVFFERMSPSSSVEVVDSEVWSA